MKLLDCQGPCLEVPADGLRPVFLLQFLLVGLENVGEPFAHLQRGQGQAQHDHKQRKRNEQASQHATIVTWSVAGVQKK